MSDIEEVVIEGFLRGQALTARDYAKTDFGWDTPRETVENTMRNNSRGGDVVRGESRLLRNRYPCERWAKCNQFVLN